MNTLPWPPFWHVYAALACNGVAAGATAFCLVRFALAGPRNFTALIPAAGGAYHCLVLQTLLMVALPACLCSFPIAVVDGNRFGRSLDNVTVLLTVFLCSHPVALIVGLGLLGVDLR